MKEGSVKEKIQSLVMKLESGLGLRVCHRFAGSAMGPCASKVFGK